MNGGVCIDGVDSFKCSCPDFASGVLCQCVNTSKGQECQPLPHWFENKPYQPNVPFDRKKFDIQFNISFPQNDSVTTVRDVYMTSVSEIAEFPSAVVPSDHLISSLKTPTFSLDLMDVFTPSPVISAKISLVFSELPSITVPYFSSEIYESPSPFSRIDSSFLESSKSMKPTPVLPVLTSSLASEEESVTFYEYLTETSVLLPTTTATLEGSFPTPSTESFSLTLVSDVSIPLFIPD